MVSSFIWSTSLHVQKDKYALVVKKMETLGARVVYPVGWRPPYPDILNVRTKGYTNPWRLHCDELRARPQALQPDRPRRLGRRVRPGPPTCGDARTRISRGHCQQKHPIPSIVDRSSTHCVPIFLSQSTWPKQSSSSVVMTP